MDIPSIFKWILQLLARKKRVVAPKADVMLGVASSRDSRPPFVIVPSAQRPQHIAIMGLSGSGKTHLIEHMIRQDIQNGVGFVVFDVHGDLADRLIAYLAERATLHPDIYDRTGIFEPFNLDRAFAFNPLETSPHTSPFLQAHQFAYILRKRWQEAAFGARTEELLRNTLYTLAANGRTLLDIPRLLTDGRVRSQLVLNIESQEIRTFWQARYNRLSHQMQSVMREPILTRISSFVNDPQVRDIVGQAQSTFSFREAMTKGLWVIFNLSKGKLGENSSILGSLLFTKLELEIMGRANIPEDGRRLFAVYADEVQNFASDSFEHLITEARKYRVALVSGHQFWSQLEPALRQAMLAVGSKAYLRLHYHDAVELAGELAATERRRYVKLLTTLDRGEAIVRIGHQGPVLVTVPDHRRAQPTPQEIDALRRQSDERFTRTRAEVKKSSQKQFRQPIATMRKHHLFN